MKFGSGTIGTLLFTAIGTAAFVGMAKRPAVDATAMSFGMPNTNQQASTPATSPTTSSGDDTQENVAPVTSTTTDTPTKTEPSNTPAPTAINDAPANDSPPANTNKSTLTNTTPTDSKTPVNDKPTTNNDTVNTNDEAPINNNVQTPKPIENNTLSMPATTDAPAIGNIAAPPSNPVPFSAPPAEATPATSLNNDDYKAEEKPVSQANSSTNEIENTNHTTTVETLNPATVEPLVTEPTTTTPETNTLLSAPPSIPPSAPQPQVIDNTLEESTQGLTEPTAQDTTGIANKTKEDIEAKIDNNPANPPQKTMKVPTNMIFGNSLPSYITDQLPDMIDVPIDLMIDRSAQPGAKKPGQN